MKLFKVKTAKDDKSAKSLLVAIQTCKPRRTPFTAKRLRESPLFVQFLGVLGELGG
jgi:hypothetical protein